ncbi:PGRP2 amidase, partial [Tricholaema leucomelas]|nr:PGRP2 amidase [Tricholaema leucomelas]
LPPRRMDSVVQLLEALESTPQELPVPALGRALGACSTPVCRAVLGDPPPVPTSPPRNLSGAHWALLTQLLHHDPSAPHSGAVLAPDGTTLTLGPLLVGIEVGLKRASGWHHPTLEPGLDALLAVTITEALGTSFLLAGTAGTNLTTLGPDGCWDDIDAPQNYTLLAPTSPIPDAVANGAMDGVLLGARLAQGPSPPLAELLKGYYGTAEGTEQGRRVPSSYRRPRFGALVGAEKLAKEVAAVLEVLKVMPTTRRLMEGMEQEEVVGIARRAARDFLEVYVECPAIISRCTWGASPYRGTPTLLTLPLASVYIHHTFVPSTPCASFATCAHAMRSMQAFHQDARGWDDIGYSFVVGSDGYLYQGRGWHWVGAHTKGYNSRGYGLGYVGDFSSSLPQPDALSLVRDNFLPCAIKAGRLMPNYTIRGHRQLGTTHCPGTALFQEIQTWPGFQ